MGEKAETEKLGSSSLLGSGLGSRRTSRWGFGGVCSSIPSVCTPHWTVGLHCPLTFEFICLYTDIYECMSKCVFKSTMCDSTVLLAHGW